MKSDIVKKLEKLFIFLIFIPLLYILNNLYQDMQFKNNPLSHKTQELIKKRQDEVLLLIQKKYNMHLSFPLLVSDEFDSRLFGLTVYKDGNIKIYLNKKRFKESQEYMLDEVIPHEYAHAVVILLGKNESKDGHTRLWQKVCLDIDGKFCERYVDNEELVSQKMKF